MALRAHIYFRMFCFAYAFEYEESFAHPKKLPPKEKLLTIAEE